VADISVEIAGMRLKNPFIFASGVFGKEYSELYALSAWGAVTTKSLTYHPRDGNPSPRIAETPCGLLNSIGLANPGVMRFIKEELPFLNTLSTRKVISIAGETEDEFAKIMDALSPYEGSFDAYELNVSCPNVSRGGMAFGTSAALTRSLVARVRLCTDKPLIVKLTPNVTDIVEVAQSACDAGADAISLINTIVGMVIDIEHRKPLLGNKFGGLSGPAVKPVAVACVYKVASAVSVPVIGGGGISSWRDVVEFLMAGADAVFVGSAVFANPTVINDLTDGLSSFIDRGEFSSIRDIIGVARG